MNRVNKTHLLASAALAIFAAVPATAQTAPAPPRAGISARANDADIIVTANKRPERALEVPGAITAFRGDDLLANGTTSIADFAGLTPGLQFNNGLGSGAPIIRGISEGVDTSPTVASVVNGAQIGSSSSLAVGAQDTLDLDPIDVERVEVLKGPQGTLYGASTLGGLISYTLRDPSLTQTQALFRGSVDGTRSGGASYSMRGNVSTPLVTDRAAFGLSGYYDRRGGFIDNAVRGTNDQNKAQTWGVRGTLLLRPTDALTIKVNGFYQRVNSDANDFVLYDNATHKPIRDLHYDQYVLPSTHKRIAAIIANVDYDFGPATLSAVSTYQDIKSDNRVNETNTPTNTILSQILPAFGGVPYPSPALSDLDNLDHYKKTTQELRLTSNGDGRLSWIVGGYYTYEKDVYDATFRGIGATGTPIAGLDPALSVTLLPTLKEYSAFANATFKITPRIDVTGGVRVGGIDQSSRQLLGGSDAEAYRILLLLGNGTTVPTRSARRHSSDSVETYLATARYHISRDGMVFARFATGFRVGGPNISGPGLPASFNPDRTTNYEVGLKSKILGGMATIDLTAYYTRWKDIIVLISPGGISGYTNGGNARVYGLEAALSLRPARGLSLNGTFAYSKGNITSVRASVAGELGEGDELPFNPRMSGSISARYEAPLSGEWVGYGAATARFSGSRLSSFTSVPFVYRLPGYTLVDLHAGVQDGRYTIDLFIKNVTDKRAQLAANAGMIPEIAIQRPRTIGAALTVKY